MNKLLSMIVAVVFAASSAFVVSPAGAQTKDETKTEKKAKSEKAKTDKAKTDKAKTDKAKTAKSKDTKKNDEMKK